MYLVIENTVVWVDFIEKFRIELRFDGSEEVSRGREYFRWRE